MGVHRFQISKVYNVGFESLLDDLPPDGLAILVIFDSHSKKRNIGDSQKGLAIYFVLQRLNCKLSKDNSFSIYPQEYVSVFIVFPAMSAKPFLNVVY